MTTLQRKDSIIINIWYKPNQQPFSNIEILEMLQKTPLWNCLDIEVKDLLSPQKPIHKKELNK